MKAGLIIANEGGTIERDTIYDSRRTKLTTNPDAREKHFDIVEPLSGGTKWIIPDTSRTTYSEDLVRIKHDMPFTPQYQAYFTLLTYTGSFSPSIADGQYSMNRASMVYNAFGLGEEWLEAESDALYFYIRHKALRDSSAFGSWTTEGSNFQYKARYFIFNQPNYIIPDGKFQMAQ